jgi:hypothetical protein
MITAQTSGGSESSAGQFDITYNVRHSKVDSGENPIDVYTVDIFKNATDTIQLSKYISKSNDYYFISLLYVGYEYRYRSSAIIADLDGFVSEHRYSNPYRADLSDGTGSEIVTVIIDYFFVNDLRNAENIRIRYETEAPFILTPEGVENVSRFITEMEGAE